MESISQDSLRQILLKLPTRDVARCCRVCKRWCLLLTNQSFLTLHVHAAHLVSGAGVEGLLISKTNPAPGRIPKIVLFNLTSAMPMCHFSDLDSPRYRPANACNGFLCLVSDLQGAPLVVCNPVTSEKLRIPAPAKVESIASKLYVVTLPLEFGNRHGGILAIDVTSEVVRTHSLPKHHMSGANMTVDTLELQGQLCVAIHDFKMPFPKLTFWVLTTMEDQNRKDNDDMWELRYSFPIDAQECSRHHCYYRCECHPRGAWLDDSDGVLCYLAGGHMYKYDTTVNRRSQYPSLPASNMEWDHRLKLQPSNGCRWNVYAGYRPSLLSPQHFATSLSSLQHDEQPLEHPLLQTMPSLTPSRKRHRSPSPSVDNDTDKTTGEMTRGHLILWNGTE